MYDAYTVTEHDPKDGFTLKIVLDPEPFHPFEDDEGKLSTFVFEHRRYTLGDTDRAGYEARRPDIFRVADGFDRTHPDVLAFETVYMLDHSGLRFWTDMNAPLYTPYGGWDSGIIGFAVVTRQDFERVGLDPDAEDARQRAKDSILSEVKCLDQYHSGQVLGYQIVDAGGEVVDDAYGYYGEQSDLEEEAEGILDRIIEGKKKGIREALDNALALG